MKRLAWALMFACAGCQPHYNGLDLRVLTGTGSIDGGEIHLVEGQTLAIAAEPISGNPYEDYEAFNIVELEAIDQTTVLAAPSDGPHRFVLVGVRPGTTAIDVVIDDVVSDHLSATVASQEVLP